MTEDVQCKSSSSPKRIYIDCETNFFNNNNYLKVKKLSEKAKLPVRGSIQAVGYDIFAAVNKIVPAHGKALIATDLALAVPAGCYGRIAPRSGLALHNHIDIGAGVVDPDYRGNVGVILFNHGTEEFNVCEGDRIAQLILEKVKIVNVVECSDLDVSERGDGAFGSTGRN